MTTLRYERDYIVVHCGAGGCEQEFAMSRIFYNRTQRDGTPWYCPSGHSRRWSGDSLESKLEAERIRSQHLSDQLQAAEAAAEHARSQLLRDRHRFAKGVCPCCTRSFTALARHMATKHPDFDRAGLAAIGKGSKCSCGRRFDTPHGLAIHQGRRRGDDWANPKKSAWHRHLTVVS